MKHFFEALAREFFCKFGFTPSKAEQLLGGIELQEKEAPKNERIQKTWLERAYGDYVNMGII